MNDVERKLDEINRKPSRLESKERNTKHEIGKSSRNRRRYRKRRRSKIWILAVVIAAIMLFVFIRVSWLSGDKLEGTWSIDEITSYQFDGNGKGALVLPDKTYEFLYAIEEDQLRIDFINANARDFQYSFTIDGDYLILSGGEGKESITYELIKKIRD